MSLAGIVLFVIWMSLCVVIIGGWAFKTLDDVDFPAENEDEPFRQNNKYNRDYINFLDEMERKAQLDVATLDLNDFPKENEDELTLGFTALIEDEERDFPNDFPKKNKLISRREMS